MTRRRVLLSATAGFAAVQYSLHAQGTERSGKLTPPSGGRVPVAVPISQGAVVIDYSGPWEVFQDTQVPSGDHNVPGFELYTVANSTEPVTVSGGMKVVPNYTFANAPAPKVVVIPAQSGNDAMREWIRKSAAAADLTMSVCTGAFILAETGLLAGKEATTHHGSYSAFAMQFHDIKLKRGLRYVEAGSNLASAGGLTSGIDLALHVVERYYGRYVAERTAFYMEYQGKGWQDPATNAAFAEKPKADGKSCGVCGMAVSPTATLQSTFKGVVYRFCTDACKQRFDQSPADFASTN